MNLLLKYKYYFISVFAFCFLGAIICQNLIKCPTISHQSIIFYRTNKKEHNVQTQTKQIFDAIDKRMPKVTFTHKDNTTSAKNSKVFMKNPKESYGVGDHLIVQVEVYDYLGKKKAYGGDLLRARISNPETSAGASGRIDDFNNGTYHVHFTLFWEGKVVVTVLLMHPSEAVSALWKARNSWHGHVDYIGKFTSKGKAVETKCGFDLNSSKELCEYIDERDEEYFYCVKHPNFTCESYTEYKSWRTLRSQLTKLEVSLLDRSTVRLEIPIQFQHINVSSCNGSHSVIEKECKTGTLEFPSGYVIKELWHPKSCIAKTFHSMEELNTCMKGKMFYFFGDSTIRLWMKYIQTKLKTLTSLNVYETGWSKKILAVDTARNIQVIWKRHARPFINVAFVSEREERTIPREMDLIGGNKYTVIAISIGIHFRSHPVHHFIRRLLNIRRAIERLFIRSPETKVIIKTENTSEMAEEYEGMSDFHGSIHYLIMEMVFKDLNVGFVNGWDMTTAFNTNQIHPSESYVRNEINMLMTYVCN